MILDAVETVLGFFGFDRTVYGIPRNNKKKRNGMTNCMKKQEDIQAEMKLNCRYFSLYDMESYTLLCTCRETIIIIKRTDNGIFVFASIFV